MNIERDIRWKQRFNNYQKALSNLEEFTKLPSMNKYEEQGLIQAFEYTHELAWNVLKDFLESSGEKDIFGSRDAVRISFRRDLIQNGKVWMDMIEKRNLTSHTYNEDTAKLISTTILSEYFAEFMLLKETLTKYL